ncbi:disease resistance protein RFL1-like [Cornus florida]|uniref:disease resistance protein RFL1-like n=1 Tax=Cornus florida TaxID=4283 RepID=UPI00289D2142|nr:disease resistance protein RFL1-like [Cornus florida]
MFFELSRSIFSFDIPNPLFSGNAMWMELLTLAIGTVILKVEFAASLWNKIELLKNVWTFVNECPEWLYYHNHLTEKVQALEAKMVALGCREYDVRTEVENTVPQTGYQGKEEVRNWLGNVQAEKAEVENISGEFQRGNFFSYIWFGGRVEKHIREVEGLSKQGRFPEGLLIEAPQSRRVELLTTPLVGDVTPKRHLENVWESLMDEQVLRIVVVGVAGVGKTFIMSHVQNRLLEDNSTFKYVYWVTVSRECDIHELQNDIAKEVGIDVSNERDKMKRAARLHRALKDRKKSVLILDDVRKQVSLIEVGIPTERDVCKLIVTTRSSEVCRRMGGRDTNTITMEPLQDEEAEMLFMEKLQPNSPLAPELLSIAKMIVKECGGLPGTIITEAEKLMGIYDINEWRNALNEIQNLKN